MRSEKSVATLQHAKRDWILELARRHKESGESKPFSVAMMCPIGGPSAVQLQTTEELLGMGCDVTLISMTPYQPWHNSFVEFVEEREQMDESEWETLKAKMRDRLCNT